MPWSFHLSILAEENEKDRVIENTVLAFMAVIG